jgi:O-antigen/teichoic acid export membrane protein
MTAPVAGPDRSGALAAGVARGGAANLLGAAVWGLSSFVLLIILNRGLGVADAGVVIVAIAVFSVVTVMTGLGTSTGLIRTITHLRATDRTDEVPAMMRVALVPVTAFSLVAAVGLWLAAPWLAGIFSGAAQDDEVASVLRAMVPFVPFATLHTVVVNATQGFDTMLPHVLIERIGRAIALPTVCGAATAAGLGPRGVGAVWAASNVAALALSARWMQRRISRVVREATPASRRLDPAAAREFWSYTWPRAVAQTSNVAIDWFDTILVGAVVSTTLAGVYASGTRYLLPGLFAADALVRVVSPRLGGLLARHNLEDASRLVQVVGGWQVAVMWPIYLITALFPTPLLQVFGPEVVEARGALIALSVAMLLVAPVGPSRAVIVMGGRSRQAMVNTLTILVINISGNLLLVPRYGITAAGVVWGLTNLSAAAISGWQAKRGMGIDTVGAPAWTGVALAASTFGVVGVAVRLAVGDDLLGLLLAGSIASVLYGAGLWQFRARLHLDSWWSGIRRRSVPGTPERA